jgi:hypothetical protein
MQKGYSNDPRTDVPPGVANSAYYAERAAFEREHAVSASNEVVASVREKLACRYAAMATQLAPGTSVPNAA